jgi:hypothetical protein
VSFLPQQAEQNKVGDAPPTEGEVWLRELLSPGQRTKRQIMFWQVKGWIRMVRGMIERPFDPGRVHPHQIDDLLDYLADGGDRERWRHKPLDLIVGVLESDILELRTELAVIDDETTWIEGDDCPLRPPAPVVIERHEAVGFSQQRGPPPPKRKRPAQSEALTATEVAGCLGRQPSPYRRKYAACINFCTAGRWRCAP